MKQLTKEFWDDLYRQFPEGMKIFNEWFEIYKSKTGWKFLFNKRLEDDEMLTIGKMWENVVPDSKHETWKRALANENDFMARRLLKYHDLPHAMQVGIWLQFESEIATRSNSPFYYFKAAECIKAFIKNLHEEATD